MKRKNIAAIAVASCALAGVAQGETLSQFFAQSTIDGQIRSYYFSRLYGTPDTPNAYAYSLAGRLNVLTAPFLTGFQVGVSFYTANAMGTLASNPDRVDKTLMGDQPSVNALGQAYIEYSDPWFQVKVGNQLVDTPWLNRVGGRVIPVTYQGVTAQVYPMHGLTLEGVRIFRWKDRTTDNFYRDNLYYPGHYAGDSLYGGPNVLPNDTPASNGAFAFGARYTGYGAKTQAWFYQFDQFTSLFYWAGSYRLPINGPVQPFLAAQFTRGWGAGEAFASTDTTLFNQPGQGVNATSWGLKAGFHFPHGSLWYAYAATELHPGALGGGAIVSPYTVGYTADPLYVDAMIQGLVGVGPGHGWRVRAAYWPIPKQLQLTAGFSQFNTYFSGDSNWTHFNVSYFPEGFLKGLCLRDQVEVGNGGVTGLYPGAGQHSFVYNRVMFTYKF
ncbi:OprD family outer membrane porin [Acidithiobacillus sp. IBUN Pt1247-S3]|uniref:OprD family outer membrane porin n=1 Tax=Acidithiobacillus sp. IBUN Pt1247-S3 TaxID=3166642 RepID=UPI0034E3AE2B